MALLVHLPLLGNLNNQGLAEVTYTGTPVFKTTGKIGNSAFDLSNRVTFSCPSLDGVKTFSIAFWGKVNSDSSLSTNWVDVISFTDRKSDGSVAGAFRWETCYNGANYTNWGISVHDNGNYNISDLAGIPQATGKNIWHHIVITADLENNEVKEYLNGVLVGTATCNGGSLTGTFHFGENNLINGEIQDVRIYDNVLSQLQISELKKMLILHYPLDNNGIGGKNLLVGTNNGIANWQWTMQVGDFTKTEETTLSGIKGCKFIRGSTTHSGWSVIYYGVVDESVFKPSTNYVLSVDIYTTVETSFTASVKQVNATNAFTFDSKTQSVIPNKWNHVVFNLTTVSTLPSSTDEVIYFQNMDSSTGVSYIFKNLKLEEGDKATPWCPNPSDALYTALGYDDGIEYDTSGYGNNGTKVGTFDYSIDSPRYLASTVFENDCSQYIHTPYLSFLTNEITMSCWVHQTSASNTEGTNQYIMSQGRDTNGKGFSIRSNNGVPYLYMNTGSGISLSSGMNILNEWHHLVATYDGSNACIYIDGQLKNSKSITGSIDYSMASERFVVGKMSFSYTSPNHYFPFVGKISDARVYATALSDTEIQKLYTVSASIDSNGNAYSAAYVEG